LESLAAPLRFIGCLFPENKKEKQRDSSSVVKPVIKSSLGGCHSRKLLKRGKSTQTLIYST
jgi:hypothetical protein